MIREKNYFEFGFQFVKIKFDPLITKTYKTLRRSNKYTNINNGKKFIRKIIYIINVISV